MNGNERRKKIIEIIRTSNAPVSGTYLAKELGVSRQVIVQDLALLRTSGENIISTNRGYVYSAIENAMARVYKVRHTDEQIEDELNTIVDLGATVVDVFVSHKAYGTIRVEMNIHSRKDVKEFLKNLQAGISTPLKNITSDYHYHTVSAEDAHTLDLVYEELEQKGYLVSIDDWDWEQYVDPMST